MTSTSMAPPATSTSRDDLFGDLFGPYAPLGGAADELFVAAGEARAALRRPLAALLGSRGDEFARAQALAERSSIKG